MRKLAPLACLAGAAVGLPGQADAQVAGRWHVIGDVSSHHFEMDCQFDPHDAHIDGACTETGGGDSHVKAGKVHPLSQGSFSGQQVHWAYPVNVMLMSFDISFDGRMADNTMAGIISAAGRKGRFTAVRK